MVFPFLREKLERPVKFIRIMVFERRRNGRIAHFRIEEIGFPRKVRGRMRIRIGYHRESVERRQPPVHRRIGRQARFERMDMRRQVSKAFFDGVKARIGSEQRKMWRPNMRRDKDCLRTDIKRDLKQVPARKAEDGPSVRMQVERELELPRQRLCRLERGQQDHIVDFAYLAVLFIDRADLPRKDKPRRCGIASHLIRKAVFLF